MSATGSTSSRGTHSRSPSRSRSPPYSDGRYLPRYSSRYDSYSYRPRSGMTAAIDDYWELRDRERDRERERDRSMLMMREDRYMRGRYTPYYRDETSTSHHYTSSSSSSNIPRDYNKPSSTLRREGSTERPSTLSTKAKDESSNKSSINAPESYTSRYSDWRERERDRDRRYRDDDRRRDFDRRSRDGYGMRDIRYDTSSYTSPTSAYPPPPFGGDSYRPGGRDREPSSPGTHYYDRDNRDRFEDRDFYRPVSRGSSIEFDRYRNRPPRTSIPSTGPSSTTGGLDRNTTAWRANSRERDRDTGKSVYGTTGSISTSSRDDNKSTDTKFDDIEVDQESVHSISVDTGKVEGPSTVDSIIPDKDNNDDQIKVTNFKKTETTTHLPTNIRPDESNEQSSRKTTLRVDVSLPTSLRDNTMDIDAPTPTSASTILSSQSPASAVLPAHLTDTKIHKTNSPQSSSTYISPSQSNTTYTDEKSVKSEHRSLTATKPMNTSEEEISLTTTKVKLEMGTSSNIVVESSRQISSSTSPVDNSKENTEPNTNVQVKSEPIMSQQQIVARIDEIENDITMYEEMLEQINKQEADSKQQQQPPSEVESPADTKDEDEDTEEEAAAKKQALQVISEGSQPMTDIQNLPFNDSPMMRRRPQVLMDQIRTHDDNIDNALSNAIISVNRQLAKETSRMINGWQGKEDDGGDWSDEEKWCAPIYSKIQDCPSFKENEDTFKKLKLPMATYLANNQKQLKQKERKLKREFKKIYSQWKNKNMALDRMRDQERRGSDRYGGSTGYRSSSRRGRGVEEEPEEYMDGIIFTGNHDALRFSTDGASTPFGRGGGKGTWTSDAARSEAELLEIIQSLESAEMRNPELRAAKTTATIPPMILDVKERARTYDDRSGLVENPMVYYHTGTETEDVWTQQEMTAFMESYMQYPKQFDKISAAVQTKTASQCVLFYYRKKTKIDFKALMRKGRRGKNRRRERLAAAIRRATGDAATSARKGKSKGSALMADIGQAQVSRRAKEKETEIKSKELRELEEANAYWDGVAERRKSKRPSSAPNRTSTTTTTTTTTTTATATANTTTTTTNMTTGNNDDVTSDSTSTKRKTNKRKGRSPRSSVTSVPDTGIVFPEDSMVEGTTITKLSSKQEYTKSSTLLTSDSYQDDQSEESMKSQGSTSNTTMAKWTDQDKNAAVDAFKELGRDFIKVASKVGTKTDEQCRNFYFNHKRKYGPNAFGEEDNNSEFVTTPETTSPSIATNTTTMISDTSTIKMETGRTGLKAEEEDAAAALVGLFQMGGSRDHTMDTTSSPLTSYSSPVTNDTSSGLQHPSSNHPGLQQQPYQPQQKGRRRARTTSGKMDSTDDWTSDDMTVSTGRNILGKKSGLEPKRASSSSYWSVSERGEFVHYLEQFGRDWTRIANAMKTKTMIQVRNFYQNNEEKMQLDKIVHRREGIQPASSIQYGNKHIQQQMPPMGATFDNHPSRYSQVSTSSSPPQPYHTSISLPTHSYGKSVDPSPVATPPPPPYHTTLPPGPRAGYFNPSSSTRSTQSMDYPSYDTPPSNYRSYGSNYTHNNTQQHRPQSAPSGRNILNPPSTTSPAAAVTRVSDLLNSNDEPADTNNQNSWETWFGA
ncbi:uncharacterized protein BX664DRAFT_151335 [Halteromyces radiatus]|uniref:uncharacterized protein n=1 Tax=Halteromyces radiatus TaxID=101107 RepID=UPI002220A22C|nr:uncharacterized protein BX664DRAFT_151335 [Halteromyces radiatus]KAI8086135.1 hypothetical protein BX664DRAFT_151335 [Halteromyces radiatus]